jgi:hypothetical protein
MHHFIYVPQQHIRGFTVEERLSAVGLSDHGAGADSIHSVGPAGPGHLFAWRKSSLQPMHYNSDEQTWIPAAKKDELPEGRYWVGFFNNSPPTEEDLRRPGVLYGDDIELGDGKPWMIPAPHFLPHDLMLQADGTLKHEPKQRYQDVSVEAARWRFQLAGGPQKVTYDGLFRFCLQCLNLNYRLPSELASHLRLIDTENVKRVMQAALKTDVTYG